MAYTPQNFEDGKVLKAEELNHIEAGIAEIEKNLKEKQPAGNYIEAETDPTVPSWAKQPTKPTYTANEVGARPATWMPSASEVGADPSGTAETKVSNHNTDTEAHNDIRLLLTELITQVNSFLDVDDTTRDQLSEILRDIDANKTSIESITSGKVNVTDIINNLTTNVANKPLSAAQGVALKGLIDALQTAVNAIKVPTKTSDLENDSGFLTEHQSLDGYAKTADHYTKTVSDNKYQPKGSYLTEVPSEYVTETELTNKGYAKQTEVDSLSEEIADHESNTTMHVSSAEKQVWNNKVDASQLPTITQEAGNSESLVMSQAATTKLVEDALAQIETEEYETVDSVAKMTDTSKSYVLSSTGTLWAYGETTVEIEPPNKLVPSTATLNQRLSGSSGSVSANSTSVGSFITDFIAVSDLVNITPFNVRLNWEMQESDDNKALYYNSSKARIGNTILGDGADNSTVLNGETVLDLKTIHSLGNTPTWDNVAYVRFQLFVKPVGTSLTSADIADKTITFDHEGGTKTENAWYDTGITPSEGGGAGGNYVTLLAKVNENTSDIKEVSNRITALETGSETLTIPTFWQSAVDECIAKIKAVQVGRNCITFPFFSDNHQRNGYAGMLIAHIMKECNIPYCIYGGDSISSGTIVDEAEMIEQDKAFATIMSYVPNGRLCRAVGNHDGYWYDGTNKFYYTREQVYELFLREESIAQNKHFGEDGTYYYVDDIASKTRFIILNTNGGSVDATQIAWLQNTALSFNESGWTVMFISHQPLSNHYHANISNATEVISVIKNYINGTSANKARVAGCCSGHIHRDRIYTGIAVNTTDDTEGDDMGFTQVTITSDHTSIAYDDATKHTVANDDQSHAIDFITLNHGTGVAHLTRLGIGNDRSYTY